MKMRYDCVNVETIKKSCVKSLNESVVHVQGRTLQFMNTDYYYVVTFFVLNKTEFSTFMSYKVSNNKSL